jgi:hypothetical protein
MDTTQDLPSADCQYALDGRARHGYLVPEIRRSTAAVKIGTSGWASPIAAMPSGHVSRQTNLIDLGLCSLSRSTAATAELPVAGMGSTTTTSRSCRPAGS